MKKRAVAIILLLIVIFSAFPAVCEEFRVFILCNPESHVNVRKSPKNGSEKTGWVMFADSVLTDGKTKNGYLHVIGITEDGEGWIKAGYTVKDQPVKVTAWAAVSASGRVMSYRNAGKNRLGWVPLLAEMKVYALSEEWAVTSRGYIRLKYLEVWYK